MVNRVGALPVRAMTYGIPPAVTFSEPELTPRAAGVNVTMIGHCAPEDSEALQALF